MPPASSLRPHRPWAVLSCLLLLWVLLGLAATVAPGAQFTLSWTDNATTEIGFRVERSTDGASFAEIATTPAVPGTGGQGTYVDAGLPDDTVYWYRVRAYNAGGNSGYSNVASKPTPPAASTDLDIQGEGGDAVVQGDLEVQGDLLVRGQIIQQAAPPGASVETPPLTIAAAP